MTYTTREAATALGISPRRVRQACKKDGLGWLHGRDWLLVEKDIEYMRSRIGKHGRPTQQGD